jgi:hypothetical protein
VAERDDAEFVVVQGVVVAEEFTQSWRQEQAGVAGAEGEVRTK